MRKSTLRTLPAIIAAFATFPMIVLVVSRGVDLPFWDEWAWTGTIYAAHRHALTFALLWTPHNEHRIFFPQFLMLALDRFGGWNPVREQLLSVAMLAVTQVIVWLLLRRTVTARLAAPAFLAATVLFFGLAQYENLDWGFQMAWFLCDLAMVVAVWALARAHRGSRELTIAIAAAMVGSLSSSQGLATWIAGLVVVVLIPRRAARTAAIWICAGLIVAALARIGVQSVPSSGSAFASNPAHVATYLCAYLGAPLAASFGEDRSAILGLVLLLWLGALGFSATRVPLAWRVRMSPWLGIASYVLACAALTTAGRGGKVIFQAMSSRYTSISTFAWIGAIVATIVLAERSRRAIAFVAVPLAVATGLSVLQSVAGDAIWSAHAHDLRAERQRLARIDASGLQMLYPNAHFLTSLFMELSEIRDGIFSAR